MPKKLEQSYKQVYAYKKNTAQLQQVTGHLAVLATLPQLGG